MAQKVTAMDVRMAAAIAAGERNVAGFCREQGISRQTYYKWRRRFLELGVEGLAERSRRPLTQPGAIPAELEDLILEVRKDLSGQGLDAGADAVAEALAERGVAWVPSRATVWRALVRRGAISPQPQKRPHSSLRRFVFARPNECWQCDWTEWQLQDGRPVAIAGVLDDHSRLLTALRTGAGDATAGLVWDAMLHAFSDYGLPAQVLSDNGSVYSRARQGGEVAFEANLRALGIGTITSRPYHPQTCGKIERSWQTLKRWLRAHPEPRTLSELQALLDDYRAHYNEQRRHRGIHRQTPLEAFNATVKARPADRPMPTRLTITDLTVTSSGNVHLGGRNTINVGLALKGRPLTCLRDGDHVVLLAGHQLVRQLTIDPTRRYQPSGNKPGTRAMRP